VGHLRQCTTLSWGAERRAPRNRDRPLHRLPLPQSYPAQVRAHAFAAPWRHLLYSAASPSPGKARSHAAPKDNWHASRHAWARSRWRSAHRVAQSCSPPPLPSSLHTSTQKRGAPSTDTGSRAAGGGRSCAEAQARRDASSMTPSRAGVLPPRSPWLACHRVTASRVRSLGGGWGNGERIPGERCPCRRRCRCLCQLRCGCRVGRVGETERARERGRGSKRGGEREGAERWGPNPPRPKYPVGSASSLPPFFSLSWRQKTSEP